MKSKGILNWLFLHILKQQFNNNRREMALHLRVSERTLKNAMDGTHAAETALLFEQLLAYALERELSIDRILAQYRDESV